RGSLRGALTTTSEEPCNSLRPLNQSLHVLVLELIESVLSIIGMYDDPRSVEVTTALERDNNLALRSVLHVRVLLRVAGLVVGRSVVSWFPSKALRLSRGEIGSEWVRHRHFGSQLGRRTLRRTKTSPFSIRRIRVMRSDRSPTKLTYSISCSTSCHAPYSISYFMPPPYRTGHAPLAQSSSTLSATLTGPVISSNSSRVIRS